MTTAANAPTRSDRAALVALAGWGGPSDPSPWDRLRPGWREAMRDAQAAMPDLAPESARDRLRREHEAMARPDLRRVHPSWWVRALREEPPSVRRAVLSNLAPEARGALMAGLGLDPADLDADRPPRPEAVRSALALWSERLVGDLPERPDDPLAIRALTRLGPRELARLVHAAGLAKWALASGDDPMGTIRVAGRVRLAYFRRTFAPIDDPVRKLAARDVATAGRDGGGRHALARLGWLTPARLLADAEPYRVRWALQHLPYPVAKQTRALMHPGARPSPAWLRWEEALLRTAWSRLRGEGRLPGAGEGGEIE